MNRIMGVKYCGKRGSESLTDMVRPIRNGSNQTVEYACPEGYFACNPEFFEQPDGANFVVCKKNGADISVECPITSVKFSVTEQERTKYDYTFKGAAGTTKGVWVSRKVMQHGIESVKIMPNQPCFDENLEYSSAPNQQFWFAEIRRTNRKCSKEGLNF